MKNLKKTAKVFKSGTGNVLHIPVVFCEIIGIKLGDELELELLVTKEKEGIFISKKISCDAVRVRLQVGEFHDFPRWGNRLHGIRGAHSEKRC